MLIPRFSIRWLLGLTTVSAVVSLVLAHAVRGRPWALGVMAGVWCLLIVALLFVVSFLAAWLIAQSRGIFVAPSRGRPAGENPFTAAPEMTVAPEITAAPAMTPTPILTPAPALDEPPVMTG